MDKLNENLSHAPDLGGVANQSSARRRAWTAPELIKMDVADSTRDGGVPRTDRGESPSYRPAS